MAEIFCKALPVQTSHKHVIRNPNCFYQQNVHKCGMCQIKNFRAVFLMAQKISRNSQLNGLEDTVPTNVYTKQLYKAPYSTVRDIIKDLPVDSLAGQQSSQINSCTDNRLQVDYHIRFGSDKLCKVSTINASIAPSVFVVK